MKRATALLVLLSLLLSLTGCMTAEEKQARKDALDILNGSAAGRYTLDNGTAVDQQTLVDQDSIVVELAGLQGDPASPQLVLAVKNGSRNAISLGVDSLLINGWETSGWCEAYEIAPRSVTTTTIFCDETLYQCGIEDVFTVDLALTVYNVENYEALCSVSTYMTSDSTAEFDPSRIPDGIPLLDETDFRVYAVHFPASGDQGSITLFLENNTSRKVTYSLSRTRLNGEPVELWFWYDVSGGARSIFTEWLYDEDTFEALPVAAGDELTFDLTVSDYDTGITLATQSVSLTAGELG